MHTSELTPTVLRDLRRERRYPALSLLMPTHRHRPGTTQDPIRLRNLLTEARKRIADDPKVERAVRMDLDAQLDKAAAQIDFEHSEDGLLILVAPGEHHNWQLATPSPVPDRLVVADTFLTRNLVAARLYARPYWVLVISEEATHLWEGSGERLSRAEYKGLDFPLDPGIPDPQDAIPGPNFGTRPGPQREERLRQYFRAVDTALTKVLEFERRPVFLVGTNSALTRFDDVSEHSAEFAGRLTQAGLDRASGHEIAERLRPVLEAHVAQLDAEALERLDSARSQRRFAGGLSEVWEAVGQGRGLLLLVEEHYQAAARIEGDHLSKILGADEDKDQVAGLEEDVVDQLIETALNMETEVRFVPDGTLEGDGRVALVLRY